MSSERPVNRRHFFREGLRELLRQMESAMEPIARAARELDALETSTPTPTPTPATPSSYVPRPETHWLRPPGAMSETEFLAVCTRSGECTRVCPAQCIRIDYSGENGGGAPYIDVDSMACVLCEGLACTKSCPSGAIQSVVLADIRMGVAAWREETCMRTLGQPCTICIDRCPLGTTAIRLNDMDRIEVVDPGCVGCGVCQHECPTSPKSITVTPRSALDAARMH